VAVEVEEEHDGEQSAKREGEVEAVEEETWEQREEGEWDSQVFPNTGGKECLRGDVRWEFSAVRKQLRLDGEWIPERSSPYDSEG
jgi:hypothetical protein